MSSDFATVRSSFGSTVAQIVAPLARPAAANDNGYRIGAPAPSEEVLRAALRHFADHGLGAARAARINAEKAFFDGDRAGYDWWLGITRTLDRRLAAQAEKHAARPNMAPKAANETVPLGQ